MLRRPPRSTRTDTLFPYTTLFRSLPDLACPAGEAALELTLHPSYLAKSYYPANLLRELDLIHLGSRAAHVVPEKIVSARAEERGMAQPAPVLFLAGNAERLAEFGAAVGNWRPADEDRKSTRLNSSH